MTKDQEEALALEKDMKDRREPGTPSTLLCPAHCLMRTDRTTGERVLNFTVGSRRVI